MLVPGIGLPQKCVASLAGSLAMKMHRPFESSKIHGDAIGFRLRQPKFQQIPAHGIPAVEVDCIFKCAALGVHHGGADTPVLRASRHLLLH